MRLFGAKKVISEPKNRNLAKNEDFQAGFAIFCVIFANGYAIFLSTLFIGKEIR